MKIIFFLLIMYSTNAVADLVGLNKLYRIGEGVAHPTPYLSSLTNPAFIASSKKGLDVSAVATVFSGSLISASTGVGAAMTYGTDGFSINGGGIFTIGEVGDFMNHIGFIGSAYSFGSLSVGGSWGIKSTTNLIIQVVNASVMWELSKGYAISFIGYDLVDNPSHFAIGQQISFGNGFVFVLDSSSTYELKSFAIKPGLGVQTRLGSTPFAISVGYGVYSGEDRYASAIVRENLSLSMRFGLGFGQLELQVDDFNQDEDSGYNITLLYKLTR